MSLALAINVLCSCGGPSDTVEITGIMDTAFIKDEAGMHEQTPVLKFGIQQYILVFKGASETFTENRQSASAEFSQPWSRGMDAVYVSMGQEYTAVGKIVDGKQESVRYITLEVDSMQLVESSLSNDE